MIHPDSPMAQTIHGTFRAMEVKQAQWQDEIGFGATPTAAETLEGPKMNARHEGLCGDPGCINLIAPGCTIHLTTLGRWVCSDCADQLKEKR